MDKKQLKQAQAIYKTICKSLKSEDWNYDGSEEDLVIKSGARGDDLPIPLMIRVNAEKEAVSVYSELPFLIPEGVRNRLAVAINIINFELFNGCFDYDYNSGKILFRIVQFYRGCELNKDIIMHLVMMACTTADRYNDRLLYIAKADDLSLEQMIQIIEKD